MRTSPFALSAVCLALAACGSVTVVPLPPSDAAVDAAPPPPSDVGPTPGDVVTPPPPPPPLDGGTPPPPPPPPPRDGGPQPPPPVDAGTVPVELQRLCAQFCARGNQTCNTMVDCRATCTRALTQPGIERCTMQVAVLFNCAISRNGYICRDGGSSFDINRMVCNAQFGALETCLGGVTPPPPPPPPPPVDGGTTVYPPCETACALSERACMQPAPECRDGCTGAYQSLTGRCRMTFDMFLACIARNGFTCRGGNATPSSACADLGRQVSACAGMSGGGGGMVPPMPATDAGAPDV